MKIRVRRVEVDASKCRRCGFCRSVSICHSPTECVGCLACYLVCPYEARYVTYLTKDVECINIGVEPKAVNVETYMRITGFR
ncbi:4Fe-4S binding protein [Candidatus Bathyarchaeota archaeon]|nr:4Fe-4S binding protein [Candidatus Bathyarchaeota archaeon]